MGNVKGRGRKGKIWSLRLDTKVWNLFLQGNSNSEIAKKLNNENPRLHITPQNVKMYLDSVQEGRVGKPYGKVSKESIETVYTEFEYEVLMRLPTTNDKESKYYPITD